LTVSILLIPLVLLAVPTLANERPNKPGELPPYKSLSERTDYEKLFVYRCETIEETIGFAETPTGKATEYSCTGPNIGIALYAGKDLGDHSPEKVGQYYIDEIAKFGMTAEVFIKHEHPHGSSMVFYINGESYLREPIDPLSGIDLIEAIAAEAKLLLYTAGKIKVIPKNVSRQ